MSTAGGLSYDEAVARLSAALQFGINPSLDGIRSLTAALGSPERRFRSVQVTGTNGKTSVTRLIAMLLHAHGAHVGMYTSPHLVSYTERVAIDGMPVARELFAAAVSAAVDAADLLTTRMSEALGLPPDAVTPAFTEFELVTAAGLWTFAHDDVEWAVLEVGMGGRWDATSVVRPEVAVITGVALDHTERLGATREAIAEDKAQIIKHGAVAVLGPGTGGVEEIILDQARAVGAPVVRIGGPQADVRWRVVEQPTLPGGTLRVEVSTPGATYRDLAVVAPSYQAANLAVAVAAAEAALGDSLDDAAVRRALHDATFPGRFEVVRTSPPLVIDGSHNPEAASILAGAIAEAFGPGQPIALLGVMADKDVTGIVEALIPVVAGFVCCRSASPRALAPETLAAAVSAAGGAVLAASDDITHGIELADAAAARLGAAGVVACGSIYLAGAVRALAGPDALESR